MEMAVQKAALVMNDMVLGTLIGWGLACAVILLCFGLAWLIQWPLNAFIDWIERRDIRRRLP